jgi:hypothetical protein
VVEGVARRIDQRGAVPCHRARPPPAQRESPWHG